MTGGKVESLKTVCEFQTVSCVFLGVVVCPGVSPVDLWLVSDRVGFSEFARVGLFRGRLVSGAWLRRIKYLPRPSLP
jgi:hypothetical protein